jgi:hypothetical protein
MIHSESPASLDGPRLEANVFGWKDGCTSSGFLCHIGRTWYIL